MSVGAVPAFDKGFNLPAYLRPAVYERFTSSEMLKMYAEKPEQFWLQAHKTELLGLFKNMAEHVPAYGEFLSANGIRPERITAYEQLGNVPPIQKHNYFHQFSFKEMLWEGSEAHQPMIMTATSGSTGSPTYFARSRVLDWGMSLVSQFFMSNGPQGSTLYVCGFSMGIWIGGLITSLGFHSAGLRGMPVTIITPGINKKEIFNALRALGRHFDNVVLSGYPPFVKDILDEMTGEGINLSSFNLRLLFAAESFTENFRDYVVSQGDLRDPCQDTLSIYGTAELGAQAHETPGAIFIRRMALQYPDVYAGLFNHSKKLPTLAQYNPYLANFQEEKGQLLLSGNSAMPVLRYQVGDNGGVLNLSQIRRVFRDCGIDIDKEALTCGIKLLELPFCFVYERADLSTTLYGLQVYPQTIKRAIERPAFHPILTGKFVMTTCYNENRDQYLEVNFELKRGQQATEELGVNVEKAVIETLLRENSEYRELAAMLPKDRTRPRIVFWEYNHPTHFPSGVKQQWSKRPSA